MHMPQRTYAFETLLSARDRVRRCMRRVDEVILFIILVFIFSRRNVCCFVSMKKYGRYRSDRVIQNVRYYYCYWPNFSDILLINQPRNGVFISTGKIFIAFGIISDCGNARRFGIYIKNVFI